MHTFSMTGLVAMCIEVNKLPVHYLKSKRTSGFPPTHPHHPTAPHPLPPAHPYTRDP